MTQLIDDTGFVDDTWAGGFAPDAANTPKGSGLEVPSDADPDTLPLDPPAIRIAFPDFADGRDLQLRELCVCGAIRAVCAPMGT